MSSVKEIHFKQKTYLLSNIINNWIKENNNIYNNKKRIKFQNVSDWPKRSPFEFYNKNLIIPNNYKSLNNIKNNKKQNEKLKKINDNVNQIISKKRNEKNDNNNQNKPIKISIISPNEKAQAGSITIKQLSNEQKEGTKEIPPDINTHDIKQKNNNNEEKEIIYDFGYTQEERLEPLKLSLNKKTLSQNENEYINENNFLNNEINKTPDQVDENIVIEQNQIQENIKENKEIKKEPETMIIPKSEREIAYYKEKDLFDEEIKVNDNSISQDQMDILDNDSKKKFNGYSKISKRNKFKIFHPYCEYDYHHFESKEKKYNSDMIDYNNNKKQENIYNMLKKQRQIIENIFIKKNNNILNKKNQYNNTNDKKKLSKNISSIYENKLNRLKENHLKTKKGFKSYSTSDYYKETNWEKRQQILERKKYYSIIVLYNKRKSLEEKKNAILMNKILASKQIQKELEENQKDYFDDEEIYEIDNENNNELPEIKARNKEIEEFIKVLNDIKKNKAYINIYNSLKKYELKKKEQKKIFNTIIKQNPKLEQLLHKFDL